MFNWNLAYRKLSQTSVLKKEFADFQVTEELSFTPTGEGEHLYLRLRKTDMTTPQVRKLLQENFKVPALDVSFAGLKDRYGICEQWFSVRAPQELPDKLELTQVEELERTWNTTKLRRGQILKNTFHIRLREVTINQKLQERFAVVTERGVPNYFGAQRFGRNGDNIPAAKDWLTHRRRRRVDPFMKGIYLSTLRSLLFNSVLSSRVAAENWNHVLPGDAVLDYSPTGPLWGRGRSETSQDAGDIEKNALTEFADICADLEYAGVNQARRAFVLQPQNFTWREDGAGNIELSFALPSGSYATVVLQECLQIIDSSLEHAA